MEEKIKYSPEEIEAMKQILDSIRNQNDGIHIDYLLPGYAAKKIISYQSMRRDLLLCLDAAKRLHKREFDDITGSSLWYMLISLHGRCFTDATEGGFSKLEKDDCFGDDKILLETHEELMRLRHNFVAHRGNNINEFGVGYLRLNIKTFERGVQVKQLKREKPSTSTSLMYVKLIEHLIAVVEKKFEKNALKVWSHMLQHYKPETMGKLKIAGPTNDTLDLSKIKTNS